MNRGLKPWLIGYLLFADPLLPDVQAEPSPQPAHQKVARGSLDIASATQSLNRELDRLRTAPPPRLKVQQGTSPHQEINLATASHDFLSVSKAFAKATAQPRKPIDFQTDEERYWSDVDAFLSDESDLTADDFLSYRWAGCCLTRSERFLDPHSIVLFIALIKEGRFDAAAGAALKIPPSTGFKTGPFWESIGVNPQPLAAGGLLVQPDQSESKTLYAFLADGSDSGARLLMQITRRMKPEFQPTAIAALSTLLEKQQNRPSKNSHWVTGKRAGRNALPPVRPVPPEMQKEIIALFDEILKENASFNAAFHVAKALHNAASPEAVALLQRLHQRFPAGGLSGQNPPS